jgi:hypothetical protein
MAFYISGPQLLFETTEISTHLNSTQQELNYIYLYTTKFGTSIKIRLNRKFESTEKHPVIDFDILTLQSESRLDNGVVSINLSRTFFTGIGHVLEYVDQVLKIHSF